MFGHHSTESQLYQGVHLPGPVVQQGSVLECWFFYKKYEKTFMGIIQIASVLASEVTVREIYSHSDAEVLMEYF